VNGEYRSLIASFPKIISTPAFCMSSSAKETHCLQANLNQNIERERLINHQLTLSKDKLKH
jgi:hypothetical protein